MSFNRNFWGPLRYAIMPYGMKRCAKTGLWTVFGRDYQTLADNLKFSRMTKATLEFLSHEGASGDSVYFYGDGCTPESSKSHMEAYQSRMERLMKLTVKRDYVFVDYIDKVEVTTSEPGFGKSYASRDQFSDPA